MLENLLQQYDNLGRPDQILYAVKLADESHGVPRSDLLSVGVPAGAVEILCAVEILQSDADWVRLMQSPEGDEDFSFFFIKRLFYSLEKAGLLHRFLSHRNIHLDSTSGRIFVQNSKIPLLFSSIRNLLVTFHFWVSDEIVKSEFYIHADYQDWFIDEALSIVETAEIRDNSLEDLQAQMARQATMGKEAEEFVLAYEKRIRVNHPKVEGIKIISTTDTSAGFDILSYSSDEALMLDKFIEVKSFPGRPRFFWSANEVRVARAKGSYYYLYLVNRAEMANPEYHPIQIQNPAETMFSSEEWRCCEDGYFIQSTMASD